MGEEQSQSVVLRESGRTTTIAFRCHFQPSVLINNGFYVHDNGSAGTRIWLKVVSTTRGRVD